MNFKLASVTKNRPKKRITYLAKHNFFARVETSCFNYVYTKIARPYYGANESLAYTQSQLRRLALTLLILTLQAHVTVQIKA